MQFKSYKHQYFTPRVKFIRKANMWAYIYWSSGEAHIEWSKDKPCPENIIEDGSR